MLSVVGNIKIQSEERLGYLIATLRSYEFLKDEMELFLNVDTTDEYYELIQNECLMFSKYSLSRYTGNYGDIYRILLQRTAHDYILNFLEDHFFVLDNVETLNGILKIMRRDNVDVCKASFFKIEQNSKGKLTVMQDHELGVTFLNDKYNHLAYQHHYGSRFYLGVNSIMSKRFAEKFWHRHFASSRPHEWEIGKYDEQMKHICMIPNIELMASIDDNHGEENTCLLKRNDTKFWNIYNAIAQRNRA